MKIIKKIILLTALLLGPECLHAHSSAIQLLIKITTQARPEQFFSALDLYCKNLSGTISYQFLVTCDADDATMNNPLTIERLKSYPNLHVSFVQNMSSVQACNAHVGDYHFDTVLLAPDTALSVAQHYDALIIGQMEQHFPNYDGVLNFCETPLDPESIALPVLGKNFYRYFGYIYNPAYQTCCCDEELALVAEMVGKKATIAHNIITGAHTTRTTKNTNRDQSFARDQVTFMERKNSNFFIDAIFKNIHPKTWSILIPTLFERKKSFNFIYTKLHDQIRAAGLENEVEVLYFLDNRENRVGLKRNTLLAQSHGEYVCFVDDDDDVHHEYIQMIYRELQHKPDCVELVGICNIDNKQTKTFIHSLECDHYFTKNKIRYRSPNHLNPIKRDLAIQIKFPEINSGEDIAWSADMVKAKLLKTERKINQPYYFYYLDTNKK